MKPFARNSIGAPITRKSTPPIALPMPELAMVAKLFMAFAVLRRTSGTRFGTEAITAGRSAAFTVPVSTPNTTRAAILSSTRPATARKANARHSAAMPSRQLPTMISVLRE